MEFITDVLNYGFIVDENEFLIFFNEHKDSQYKEILAALHQHYCLTKDIIDEKETLLFVKHFCETGMNYCV